MAEFVRLGRKHSLRKGDILFHIGMIPEREYFVVKGLLRRFATDSAGNEKITQLFAEEDFISDCASYLTKTPITYSIQALELCSLVSFASSEIKDICRTHPAFGPLGDTMMQRNIIQQKEHVAMLMLYSPEERYRRVLERTPGIVQRLSVTHLAQYIGVSRETLSRLRNRVATAR